MEGYRLRGGTTRGSRARAIAASLAAAVVAAVATPACRPSHPDATGRPNIVFVLVDALRQDHVSAYGYPRPTTPFIDALARRGTLFQRAYAQAPWTAASMASLWTSSYPSRAGVGVIPDERGIRNLAPERVSALDERIPTLAEVLSEAGYQTLAITTNIYASSYLDLLRGFAQNEHRRLGADGVVDLAIGQLRKHLAGSRSGSPLFLYLHFIDVHEPIDPPARYAAMFPSSDGGPQGAQYARWDFGRGKRLDTPEFESFRSHKIALYDGALRFVDDQIARLHRFLTEQSLADDTVIVIAADHGEEFWDHAAFERATHADPRGLAGIGHGHSMFQELLRVPLVIAGPGVPGRRRVDHRVRNIDIAPTLAALAGAPAPDLWTGQSLLSEAGSLPTKDRLVMSEDIAYGPEAKAVVSGRFKLIRYRATRTGQLEFLYDLAADPGETSDLSSKHPEVVAALDAKLDALARRPARRTEGARFDSRALEELQALGYAR